MIFTALMRVAESKNRLRLSKPHLQATATVINNYCLSPPNCNSCASVKLELESWLCWNIKKNSTYFLHSVLHLCQEKAAEKERTGPLFILLP